MRQSRSLKAWGLGIFLTALIFTAGYSRGQSPSIPAGGAAVEAPAAIAPSTEQQTSIPAGGVAVENAAVGNPAPEQQTDAPGKTSGASLSRNGRPTNLSELTAFVRDSMKEHPVLTNLCLFGALIVIILINLAIRQIFLYGLKLLFNKIPANCGEYKKQL